MKAVGLFGYMLQAKDLYLAAPDLFDSVVERLQTQDPLAAVDGLIADLVNGRPSKHKKKPSFVTYPANSVIDEETEALNFLGICRGMELLDNTLERMTAWSQEIDKTIPIEKEKFALFVTDKWDSDTFMTYEQLFRYLSMNRNFWFVFLLVTKHGVTEIPFLPMELYGITRHKSGGRR